MTFFIDKDKEINKNIIVKYADGSFCYKELMEPWDFQVALDDWRFTLNFNSNTKKCTSCEGDVHTNDKKIKKVVIVVPNCKEGGLFIDDFDTSKLGVEYKSIKRTMYYDETNNIFAIGDINTKHQFYRFGIGQYVALDENKNIICALVEFQN